VNKTATDRWPAEDIIHRFFAISSHRIKSPSFCIQVHAEASARHPQTPADLDIPTSKFAELSISDLTHASVAVCVALLKRVLIFATLRALHWMDVGRQICGNHLFTVDFKTRTEVSVPSGALVGLPNEFQATGFFLSRSAK
jgi:hypothetical protein